MLLISKAATRAKNKASPYNIVLRNKKQINYHHQSGFNLIELSATLSILSITLATAAPHLSETVASVRLRSLSFELQTTLNLARQSAIATNLNAIICPLKPTNEQQCSDDTDFNANWSYGWLVYSDKNNNNQLDDTDTILHQNALKNKTNIVFNQRGRLRFFSDGSSRSAGFYLCNGSTTKTRHIKLLYTGRSRVTEIGTEKQQSICLSARSEK